MTETEIRHTTQKLQAKIYLLQNKLKLMSHNDDCKSEIINISAYIYRINYEPHMHLKNNLL